MKCAIACLLFFLAATAVSAQPLPPLPAQTLSNKKIVIPRDLGRGSVIVAGFTKQSREQTQFWAKKLREDASLSVYEIVALDGVPGFIRNALVKHLVSGIPKERHDRFLVVSESVDKLRKFVNAADDDSAYVVLLAPNGEALWRGRGAFSDAALAQLKAKR